MGRDQAAALSNAFITVILEVTLILSQSASGHCDVPLGC